MSGSSIGGIVGGAIGFFVGGPAGAAWGFSIGSAVGGYLDPVNVQGPRLKDAQAQTSTVGGVIPFGYGVFVTAGNVIWCDTLKEHKKTERQGKGGGAKTTTYTYTRSYAIGVCEGPIYGFKWIKRNGKKVYTSDPNATLQEQQYSAKWMQKASLYYGDEEQMPDSTMVAVEGVGNVPPHRGLAYIVVENDDLTELQGAIAQYEFCVIGSPPDIYVTSKPYPLYDASGVTTSAEPLDGELRGLLQQIAAVESLGVSAQALDGEQAVKYRTRRVIEALSVTPAPQNGLLKPVKKDAAEGEASTVGASPLGGVLRAALIKPEPDKELLSVSATPLGGTLS